MDFARCAQMEAARCVGQRSWDFAPPGLDGLRRPNRTDLAPRRLDTLAGRHNDPPRKSFAGDRRADRAGALREPKGRWPSARHVELIAAFVGDGAFDVMAGVQSGAAGRANTRGHAAGRTSPGPRLRRCLSIWAVTRCRHSRSVFPWHACRADRPSRRLD